MDHSPTSWLCAHPTLGTYAYVRSSTHRVPRYSASSIVFFICLDIGFEKRSLHASLTTKTVSYTAHNTYVYTTRYSSNTSYPLSKVKHKLAMRPLAGGTLTPFLVVSTTLCLSSLRRFSLALVVTRPTAVQGRRFTHWQSRTTTNIIRSTHCRMMSSSSEMEATDHGNAQQPRVLRFCDIGAK
jgi:hypothetical protein